ncbi:MAG TPA: tetratricopeptide repeat protein, partial [Elusimicrobiota bacterium]|nr:tetratricopeptide repeat protein [Elusimicrobiota bacterium]
MKRGRAPLAPFPRFWAAAALAGLALVWSSIGGWRPRPLLAGDAVMGEQLLHGLVRPHAGVSWTMPLNTVWMALASGGGGAAASALWVLPSLLLPLLLFALGWLLGSAPGALLAALTFAWIPGLMEIGNYAQSAYAVFVLLAAGLLVWRARRPGPGRDLAAGLAIGASLLFRSALAFFPPLLFAVEWLAAPRAAKPGRAAFAALVLVPYLFLLPWLAANRATEHRWIPFEDHRADMNVALGALGVVPNAEGEWRQMLPDPPDFSASGSVWLWAARESLRHPLRTARGYGARLAYVFSFEPLLFLALLAAAAAFWRSKEYRALLTLIAYFVGIHCFMTISRSYMTPLWPLAAAAAAARLRWPPRLERGGENAGDRAAAGLLLGCLAAALLACAAVLALVAAYPRRAARRPADAVEDYEAALAASPGDAWLMTRLGHQLLKRGETARASALLERAAELRPGDDEATLGRAWAETLLGRPRLMSAWSCGPSCDHETFLESFFLRSFALMKAGEPAQARASALAGLAQWEASTKTIGRLANEREAATLNALHPRSLISILLEPLQEMDLKDRERLLEEIAGLAAPRDAGDVWRELAADAQAVGDVRTAARARARMDRTSWQGSALPARPMSLPSADSHPPRARAGAAPADVAAACAAAGPDPAGFARRFPGDAEGLSAVAQCLARAGRLRPALAYADMLARAAGPAG